MNFILFRSLYCLRFRWQAKGDIISLFYFALSFPLCHVQFHSFKMNLWLRYSIINSIINSYKTPNDSKKVNFRSEVRNSIIIVWQRYGLHYYDRNQFQSNIKSFSIIPQSSNHIIKRRTYRSNGPPASHTSFVSISSLAAFENQKYTVNEQMRWFSLKFFPVLNFILFFVHFSWI